MNFKSFKNFSHLILIFLISTFLIANYFLHREVNENKLIEHTFIVKTKPEIKYVGKKKAIVFTVNNLRHPFKVSGFAYQAIDKYGLINEINIGDEIIISLDKTNFEKYIIDNKDLNWYDGSYIFIYSIKTKNREYLNINLFDNNSKKDSSLGVPYGFIGLILLIYSIIIKRPIGIVLKKIQIPLTIICILLLWYMISK